MSAVVYGRRDDRYRDKDHHPPYHGYERRMSRSSEKYERGSGEQKQQHRYDKNE